MGSLAGFSYKKVIRILKNLGFELDRQAKGSHEMWRNPITKARAIIPKHGSDIPEGTLKNILEKAKISKEEFLR